MAAQPSLTTEQQDRLRGELTNGFAEREINARVELEESGLPGRYRIYITAPEFEQLTEVERQDVLWQILRERWTREDQLRITLALTLSQQEATEDGSPA